MLKNSMCYKLILTILYIFVYKNLYVKVNMCLNKNVQNFYLNKYN